MKKLLILAASAALLMTACNKVEDYTNTALDENIPIGFSNYTPRSITKAGASYVDATVLPEGSKFVVYGYAEDNSQTWQNTTAPAFMNGVTVTFDAASSTATTNYSPVRYWPSGNTPDWLSFYGYYPAGGAGITPTVTAGLGTYAFEAQATPKEMVDFMVTDLAKDYIYGTAAGTNPNIAVNGEVPLTFHHMLTKVQFVFQTSNTDANTKVTVNSAKLYNINTKSTLTPGETFAAHTWAAATTPATYNITINKVAANVQLTNATAGTPITYNPMTVDKEDIFLMVPQSLLAKTVDNPQKLEIVWTVKSGEGDGAVETQNTSVVYLDDINIKVGSDTANLWKANKSVVYTITIGLHPIKFTGAVAAWDGDTSGAITIE